MNHYLELSQEEANVLSRALDTLIQEMNIEVARTDDRTFRRDLHTDLGTIENIRARLETEIGVKKTG